MFKTAAKRPKQIKNIVMFDVVVGHLSREQKNVWLRNENKKKTHEDQNAGSPENASSALGKRAKQITRLQEGPHMSKSDHLIQR